MTGRGASLLTALLLVCLLHPASVSVAEAQSEALSSPPAEVPEQRTEFTPEFLVGATMMPISIAATAAGLITLVAGELTQHPLCIALSCSAEARDATALFIAGAILLPIGAIGVLVSAILLATNPRHRPLPNAPTASFSLMPTQGGAFAELALAL
jgi:hypothetical protein